MDKTELIEKVKSNRFVYKIYYYVMSAAVGCIKLFIKTDEKLILFVSYGGRYYNDSPKCIYEYMMKDKRFSDYKLVWAFRKPEDFDIPEKIKIDTINYYITALKARCWITNVLIERGLNFRGKKTYYFHTTHGTLPKLTGLDEKPGSFFGWDFKYRFDCSCAQSEEEARYQLSMYNLKKEQILVCGYPKNDELVKEEKNKRKLILSKFGLPENKKIILYAPTFRDDSPSKMGCAIDLKKWQRELGNDYILLFRAHPITASTANIDKNSSFVLDVSTYPDNSELMIISDYLISDYSGIFFEYALLHRPMFCYAYDYEEYEKVRGLYFDIRRELPSGDENFIIEHIKNTTEEDIKKTEGFIAKYVTEYGHATEKAVDNIFNEISLK